jgi:hypothetical protein
MIRRRATALALSTTLLAGVLPSAALAQPSEASESGRRDARERFDRGLKLFNDGDNPGALAEFKRAYELIPNPLVLYNIGLVYAAMGRPVEAVDALDKVLASTGVLTGERLTRAKQTRDEQALRVGKLSIITNVPAAIEIDNVEVGQTPLAAPLLVAGGVHVVGVVASGYAPMRKEVTLAGGTTAEVKLDLIEMQGRVAHVTVKTHLPGAEVVIDGQSVGKTPVPESITVPPGSHAIELRRAGYLSARQDLVLGDGASGEVTLEPEEDRALLGTLGGTLAVESSESDPVVTVDGKPRGVYPAGGLHLAAGPHQVLLERGGFLAVERVITVDAGRSTRVAVIFDPTPETRAAYLSKTSSQRAWALVAGIGGLVLAGGSVGFLVWNGQQRKTAHDDFDVAESDVANPVPNTVCDTHSQAGNPAACNAPVLDAQSRISDANTRDVFGWVGVGVGAGATVLGALLLVTNGSSQRYDRDRTGEGAKGFVLPVGWATGRGGGAGLLGAF